MGSNTKRAARAVLAVALIALGAGLPASATGSPKLLSTSIDNGWGPGSSIAARFDTPLSEDSSASLTDEAGNQIPGTIALSGSTHTKIKDSIVFTPRLPDGESLAEGTHTVTFVVSGDGRNEGTTEVSKTFVMDLGKPVVRIASPASHDGMPLVFGSGDQILLAGVAVDPASTGDPDGAYRSGLAGMEIQFYNLLRNTSTNGNKEMGELRQYPKLVACDETLAGCNGTAGQMAWSADTKGVGSGYWTVKAYAVDRAGNRSIVAEVSFLKV